MRAVPGPRGPVPGRERGVRVRSERAGPRLRGIRATRKPTSSPASRRWVIRPLHRRILRRPNRCRPVAGGRHPARPALGRVRRRQPRQPLVFAGSAGSARRVGLLPRWSEPSRSWSGRSSCWLWCSLRWLLRLRCPCGTICPNARNWRQPSLRNSNYGPNWPPFRRNSSPCPTRRSSCPRPHADCSTSSRAAPSMSSMRHRSPRSNRPARLPRS